ncbi:DUF4910 domain-containing protein [Campylobacter sp.]|uniref:DUF4910 domain-containing protein n=1 Tax=Campylobacter sp. TaxID=205 RepID=UPI00259C91B8|nr:DUF4910 domain-containing protein [Campylobacter sp.]
MEQNRMYKLISKLYKIPRSITGDGFRDSLDIIDKAIGGVERFSIPSGTQVYDWRVPPEWVIRDGYIITPNGKKICQFKEHNLHILNYSAPIDKKLSLDELKEHIYTIPELPNAIAYVTSYYERRWGFCISYNELKELPDGEYHVFIDSEFKDDGELNYAHIIIPSTTGNTKEILISSYLCHPQMANNELSGPAVWSELIRWVRNLKHREYTYRFVIVPETIGSICYINRNFKTLKENVVAGFVLSCIGDDGDYSVVLSPDENSLSDIATLHTIKHITKEPKIYKFLNRGSDERQYNTPNLNLGVTTICRSLFGHFDEYHTSLDDLDFVTPSGLEGGFNYARNLIENLEINTKYQLATTCEPNLGSRGLMSTLSRSGIHNYTIPNFLAYCNGKRSVIEIADIVGVEARSLKPIIDKLLEFELIKEINTKG